MFPRLTVEENLRTGLRNKRQKHPPVFEKIFGLFPILEERRRQKAGTLSGGEQQQLAIARALAGEVRMMLLDEPTERVQPSIVDEILDLIRQVNEEDGLTVLLVEQDVDLALSVCDTYFIIDRGVIVKSGVTSQIDDTASIHQYLTV